MARVLVTAALGNVGREVARAAAAAGFTVRVADRNEARLRERFPDFERSTLDFTDPSTWGGPTSSGGAPRLRGDGNAGAALDGADFVFLLRPPPVSDMERTLNPFVDAAYAAGVRHVVFLSVAGAERRSWVPHRKVELHLEARRGGWTVLRPGFFAQNLQDAYLRDIVDDGRLYVPAGEGRVAFLDVRDAAEVAAKVFASPASFDRRALTLTGPEAITFRDLAGVLSRTAGIDVRYEPASIPGYAWHLRRTRGMPWMQILVQTILHVGLRHGDAEKVEPTVEAILGRPPHGVRDYIARSASIWSTSVARSGAREAREPGPQPSL